jgi:hypothetical protein
LNSLKISDYFDQELYNKYGEGIQYEWDPQLLINHLCSLESQKRVTDMCINSKKPYNFVIYIRPDVLIEDFFPVDSLDINYCNEAYIAIPDGKTYEGYNDQCAVLPFNMCEKYGKRIDEIIEFRKTNGRIVSEKYVKYIVDKYFITRNIIDFVFHIIRPQ